MELRQLFFVGLPVFSGDRRRANNILCVPLKQGSRHRQDEKYERFAVVLSLARS